MLIIHRKSIMLMHRPQTPQPGFGSITLLQKFTPISKSWIRACNDEKITQCLCMETLACFSMKHMQ